MLERGVDINTIDYSGNSGLHIAAKQGYYEIACMLLKQGANFESSNNVCILEMLCCLLYMEEALYKFTQIRN